VLVLGADLAGKAIQQIVRQPGGKWSARFAGVERTVEDGPELAALEKLIADHGYYPYRAEPGELEAMEADGTLDEVFLKLMRERLTQWLEIADERLRPKGVPLYFMLGNDDPPELAALLDSAPWGTNCEDKVVWIDDDHEMISWGYSNTTPWHTYREETEDELAAAIKRNADRLTRPERAIFNLHPPPLGTQLDDAPRLDDNLQVQAVLGQVQYGPVGSSAVREAELERQPLLGLHGHIHEGRAKINIGKTICINPGSVYPEGILQGALITLRDGQVTQANLMQG
jgi:Icc-related predicted phosphoesterase